MNSARSCTGTCGFTTRKKPFDTRLATGTRSFNGSNGMRSYRCGLIASRLSMPTSSVYPSGAAFATASPATTPLPPTRFSTTTGWPSVSLRRAATRRPTRSGPPPGGIGTRKRTGFDGYCASADAERKTVTTNKTSRTRRISGLGNPIEIVLPHVQVALAGLDRGVLHAQLPREFLHRAPAGVRVLDVGLGVQLEELELVVREAEQLSPAQPLDAEPAVLSEQPPAVARHIDALGAGVGDDAFEPVAVRHQPFPRRPGKLGRRQRPRVLQLVATLSLSTELRCRVLSRCCSANMRARPLVIGWWNHAQRATNALTTLSMRETTLIFYVKKKYITTPKTTSAPAATKRSVVSDTPGESGSLGAAEANFSLKFLKKSSATFFAAASTRREPICASLPPTFAFTS